MLNRCMVAFCAGTLPLIAPCQSFGSPPPTNSKLQIVSDQAVHEDGSDYLTEAIVNQTAGFGFQVKNVGEETMLLDPPELGGPQRNQYVIGTLPSFLASGATTILGVTFKPTSTGPKIETLTLRTSAFVFVIEIMLSAQQDAWQRDSIEATLKGNLTTIFPGWINW